MRKYTVLMIMLMAAACWGQYAKPGTGGTGSSDSIGVDTDGNGTVDSYIFPAVIKKGDNITLGVNGDILTITGSAGGATDSATVYSWNFVLETELGPFIDTTSTHIPVADSALKAVSDGAGNAITSTYETMTNVAKIGDDTSNFKTAYGWGNHASGGYESVTNVAKIGDDTTNFKAAYTHSQDGSNAHGDYIDSAAVHDSLDIVRGDAADTTYKIVNDSLLTIINPTNDSDSGDVLYAIITTGNDTSYEWHSLAWGGGAGDDDSLAAAEMPCSLGMGDNDINSINVARMDTLIMIAGPDTVTGIHKVIGAMVNNYIPKIDITGNDTTINWEADAGGGADSATVYGWNFVLKTELGPFIDTTSTHIPVADSAVKAANDGAGSQIATTYAKLSGITMAGDISMADYEIYNADTIEIEEALILASDTIPKIHKIQGTMADNYIPKVQVAGNDTTVQWEADAGAETGTSDTLIINEGTTEYSTISNRLKIKEGSGLDITREDSTGFDVLRFSVSLGTNINLTNEVTGLLPDSNIASATNWGTAYSHSQDNSNAHGDYIDSAAVHDSLDATRQDGADSARVIVEDSLDNYLPLVGGTLSGKLEGADSIRADTLIAIEKAFRGIAHDDSAYMTKESIELMIEDSLDEYAVHPSYKVNMFSPNLMFDSDSLILIDCWTEAALTITGIHVYCDADPTTEMKMALMFADDFIGLASATRIDSVATTAGTKTITSSFDDATVPANKALYIKILETPDPNISQVGWKITYTFD